jgi:ABC-type molybdate transport system ATPase subunit
LGLAHRIVVLANGEIADEGSFAEVVVRSDLFSASLKAGQPVG